MLRCWTRRRMATSLAIICSFPLHLSLSITLRAYSTPVSLWTHWNTWAKFPSPSISHSEYSRATASGRRTCNSAGRNGVGDKDPELWKLAADEPSDAGDVRPFAIHRCSWRPGVRTVPLRLFHSSESRSKSSCECFSRP
uniref:Putative secreted protein n=1 Tax=Ixodes ricinus TaxID=34613 RepID=A0A6B0USV8_IXORI